MKDFHGDEYKTHNQCMSEAQRYSKDGRSGWDPSAGQGNKGELKQIAWIGNLRTLVETTQLEPDVKNIVETILNHENIPRKKPKFVNFIKNIMRNKARPHSIDKTWDLFSQAMKPAEAPQPPSPSAAEPASVEDEDSIDSTEEKKTKKKKKDKKDKKNKEVVEDVVMADPGESDKKHKKKKKGKENVEEEVDVDSKAEKKKSKKKKKALKDQDNDEEENDSDVTATKKSKKRKLDDSAMDFSNAEEPDAKKSKFDWDDVITSLLEKQSDKEMSLKKLKKRCIAEYMSQHEDTHLTKEELFVKFNKKLKKRKYKILKDRVTLKTEDNDKDAEDKMEIEDKAVIATCGEKPVGAPPVQKEKSNLSFNKWEASNLGSNTQNEKFRRLMGIKSAPKPDEVKVDNKRDDKKMFQDLENNFEKAREMRQSGQGRGLGFAGSCQTGSYV